jgi:hypothetical protein
MGKIRKPGMRRWNMLAGMTDADAERTALTPELLAQALDEVDEEIERWKDEGSIEEGSGAAGCLDLLREALARRGIELPDAPAEKVGEAPLVTIPIRTRKPAKWRFVDTETGEVWRWDVAAGTFVRDEGTVYMDAGGGPTA